MPSSKTAAASIIPTSWKDDGSAGQVPGCNKSNEQP